MARGDLRRPLEHLPVTITAANRLFSLTQSAGRCFRFQWRRGLGGGRGGVLPGAVSGVASPAAVPLMTPGSGGAGAGLGGAVSQWPGPVKG